MISNGRILSLMLDASVAVKVGVSKGSLSRDSSAGLKLDHLVQQVDSILIEVASVTHLSNV